MCAAASSGALREGPYGHDGYQHTPFLAHAVSYARDSRNSGLSLKSQYSVRAEGSATARRSVLRLDGPVVTINLNYGDDESKTVVVHKDYLCSYSKYFRAALNTPAFAETEAQEVNLEELGSEPFDTFLQWLYHQSIPPLEIARPQYMEDLIRLWIFADKYIVPKLQNETMCLLNELLGAMMAYDEDGFNLGAVASKQPMSSWLEHAYKNTTEGSRLRRILADSLAVRFQGINAHNLSLELVRDIFESVQQLPDDGGPIHDEEEYYVNEDID